MMKLGNFLTYSIQNTVREGNFLTILPGGHGAAEALPASPPYPGRGASTGLESSCEGGPDPTPFFPRPLARPPLGRG